MLSGDDNLAGVAERPGHVRVCFSGYLTRGPRAGEAVFRDATEEHRVGAAEGGADGGPHLVVEVREVPVLRVLDDAVEGDEHASDDFLHDDLSMMCCRPVLYRRRIRDSEIDTLRAHQGYALPVRRRELGAPPAQVRSSRRPVD